MKTTYARPVAAALMLALLAGATLSVWPSASAAADAKSLIETRRANFKKMGKAMKTVVEQSKAESPDKAAMLAAAQVIGGYAPDIATWFPAGSGSEAGDTDALPYLWQAHDKFEAIAAKLGPEEKKLETALAGDDLAAIRAQVKVMGGVCGECHKSFRKE